MISFNPLPLSFYSKPCSRVARDLLGKGLWVSAPSGPLLCEIVETESYLSKDDPACHAARGKTPRNAPMFEQGGIAYVYFIYGMYECFNVVVGPKGRGEAVLIRGAVPVEGNRAMEKNRKRPAGASAYDLTGGPGKLTQALGIDRNFNGLSLQGPKIAVVDLGKTYSKNEVAVGPRIGITQGVELLLRFGVKGSPGLSKKF